MAVHGGGIARRPATSLGPAVDQSTDRPTGQDPGAAGPPAAALAPVRLGDGSHERRRSGRPLAVVEPGALTGRPARTLRGASSSTCSAGSQIDSVQVTRPPRRAALCSPLWWRAMAAGSDEQIFVSRHGLFAPTIDVVPEREDPERPPESRALAEALGPRHTAPRLDPGTCPDTCGAPRRCRRPLDARHAGRAGQVARQVAAPDRWMRDLRRPRPDRRARPVA